MHNILTNLNDNTPITLDVDEDDTEEDETGATTIEDAIDGNGAKAACDLIKNYIHNMEINNRRM